VIVGSGDEKDLPGLFRLDLFIPTSSKHLAINNQVMEDTNDLSGQSNDGNFGSMPALNSEIKPLQIRIGFSSRYGMCDLDQHSSHMRRAMLSDVSGDQLSSRLIDRGN